MPDRFVIEDFRNIFEAASIGIALVDNKGRPFLANPRLCSLLGYSSTELATMSFTEFTHPEDVEIDWDLYSQLIAGERESYQIHKRYFHKDGSLIHALLNVSVLHDENQSVRFAIGMVQDISREVESTEALEHSLRHNAQQAARFKLLYQIASRSDLSFHAQVEEGLKSVARLLDMDVGIISHIEGDTYTAEHVYSTGSSIAQGSQFPLGDTYSSIALGQSDVVAIERMSQSKWSSRPCYTLFRFLYRLSLHGGPAGLWHNRVRINLSTSLFVH